MPMTHNPTLTLSEAEMRAYGQQVLDMVIAHCTSLKDEIVAQPTDLDMLDRWFKEPLPEQGVSFNEVLKELQQNALSTMSHLDHPRNFSFVPGPGNYVSALADFISSSFNIFAGAWLGPSGVAAIEMKSIAWLKQLFGMPAPAGGLFVSGGSMANLTALAVARHMKLRNNPMNAAVYFSDQTHSSVPKGLNVLGFQPYQIRKITSDAQFRLPVDMLRETISADRRRGLVPFCVVANAGTTNTGAVDPLAELRKLCDEEGLWLHVDGAYGGGSILSAKGKALLKGIEKADSVAIDPHKWMFQPYEIGCVLVRDAAHLKDAFKVSAEYLDILENNKEQTNYCDYGVQLTRGFRALKFWRSLKTFGLENFRAAVEKGVANAEYAQSLLEKDACWEIVTPAQIGVVNFRFRA
ncbi:MAG: aminotransferase class I/II-fold pyridoxal phosphate-dependent enzyme, partial [Alphaproteobacteria bacterium]|nr:aminotransferase class I/II-fold pyridoxal phosphate-dependent enzyme [Alphaproteobacteria bacterium]